MNFIIGAVGANITLGVLQGVTSAASGVYSVSSTIMQSTAIGAEEVKQIIRDTDLEVKIKTAQLMLLELKINEDSPNTIKYCIQSIRDAIKEIGEELDQIHFRMQYNSKLWFGSSVRAYRFHNNKARLQSKLRNLETRTCALASMMQLQHSMYRNTELDTEGKLDGSIVAMGHVDPQIAKMLRSDLHKKVEFLQSSK